MKAFNKFLLGVTALLTAFGLMACGGDVVDSSVSESSSVADSSSPEDSSVADSSSPDDSSVADSSSSDDSSVADSSSPEDSSVADSSSSDDSSVDDKLWDEYEIITIAQALEICSTASQPTTERYYIRGIIQELNVSYGEMTIKDETGEIYVYGTYSSDGSLKFVELSEQPTKGDEVLLHCTLQNYNGKYEVKNARLIDFISNQGNVDDSSYAEMNIADARTAEKGALVKVDGVVARITYAFGMKPNGVYLVDETQSIYVYDSNFASTVSIGNTVTILAEKDYWILESEQGNADKFGYKGCNQLTNVTVVANDKATSDFNKDWISESTVKAIMENPVENDITTTIFKVNALVNKVDGSNFVNYYFNDLDGETGSYTYTQCSGSDFAWLDEFDGKICTVYLSVINAKSGASGCLYRFVPIAVQDDGFTFNKNDAAKFAVQYYGVGKIGAKYTADPAIELTTSVSSTLLGFENATITYTSDNTSVVYIENGVLHCGECGVANVTVTGAYNGVTYSETVQVTVEKPVSYEAITVADAITAAVDSEVTVKGIVGPSVVNKDGFYLFGEDGSTIAVLVNSTDAFADLEIGHEVILKGLRERYVDESKNPTWAGQTCIVNAEILVNNYGEHEYSTAKFVETTAADFYALDKAVDYSTTVFVLTATVNFVDKGFYTTLNLSSGETTVSLYMSGAGQYSWLENFYGQEVTLEIAPCNWNNKNYWAGCILAVRTAEGKVLNPYNFDKF